MGSRWMRNSFVYLLILVAVIAIVVAFFRPSSGSSQKQDISTVIANAKAGQVDRIEVNGDNLKVKLNDGTTYSSRKESSESVREILQDSGVEITSIPIDVKEPSQFGDWIGLLIQFLPILIFIGLILFMM